MKKTLSLLAIFLFLALSVTSVFAKEPAPAQKEKILNSNEVVEKDYFAASDYIAIHGTINGDAYLAGGSILIDGTVNGDIIAAGGQIIIEAKTVNNIRAFGGTIIINSKNILGNATLGGGQIDISDSAVINGSLVAAGGNLRIGGPIGKGAHIAGGQISILNDVNGDVFAGGEKIRLSQNAKVNGNFTYWSKNKITVADSAQIAGTIVQKTPPDVERVRTGSMVAVSSVRIVKTIIDVVATIVFGLLFIYLLPNYTSRVLKTVSSKLWKNLGIGFLATVITPILFVILLITIVGIPFSLLLLFSYVILAYFAKIFVSMVIGEKVFKYLGAKKTNSAWILIVGLFVYYLISLIPALGPIFVFLVMLSGIGALLITKRDYFILLRGKKII
jgi:cytoskeletal protein CcmA (bactofilin family)